MSPIIKFKHVVACTRPPQAESDPNGAKRLMHPLSSACSIFLLEVLFLAGGPFSLFCCRRKRFYSLLHFLFFVGVWGSDDAKPTSSTQLNMQPSFTAKTQPTSTALMRHNSVDRPQHSSHSSMSVSARCNSFVTNPKHYARLDALLLLQQQQPQQQACLHSSLRRRASFDEGGATGPSQPSFSRSSQSVLAGPSSSLHDVSTDRPLCSPVLGPHKHAPPRSSQSAVQPSIHTSSSACHGESSDNSRTLETIALGVDPALPRIPCVSFDRDRCRTSAADAALIQ